MSIEIPRDTVAADLVEALRGCIKTDRHGKSTTGVVRISEFKRSNVARYVDPSLLPDRLNFINAHMWDHLKGQMPPAILSGIDDAVTRPSRILSIVESLNDAVRWSRHRPAMWGALL